MSSLIVCRILASNYQANNHYNRAGAKCPIFLVMENLALRSLQILYICVVRAEKRYQAGSGKVAINLQCYYIFRI